jgi:hypothetical protein
MKMVVYICIYILMRSDISKYSKEKLEMLKGGGGGRRRRRRRRRRMSLKERIRRRRKEESTLGCCSRGRGR